MQAVGALAATVIALTFGCSRRLEPTKEDLIEHRVQPCSQWCEIHTSRECGRPVEVWDDVDDCVRECATHDGDASFGWGYQSDGTDACAAEWTEMSTCASHLTCEDQRVFFSEDYGALAESERPCWEPFDTMVECQNAHPYQPKQEGG